MKISFIKLKKLNAIRFENKLNKNKKWKKINFKINKLKTKKK